MWSRRSVWTGGTISVSNKRSLPSGNQRRQGRGGILSTAISSRSLCFAPLRLYSRLEKPRVNNGSSRSDGSSTNNKGVQRSMSVFHKQQIVQRSMVSLPQTTNEYSRVWSVFHKQQNTTEYGQSSTNNK